MINVDIRYGQADADRLLALVKERVPQAAPLLAVRGLAAGLECDVQTPVGIVTAAVELKAQDG